MGLRTVALFSPLITEHLLSSQEPKKEEAVSSIILKQVCFSNEFWKYVASIKNTESHKQILNLLEKISSGWRQTPEQNNHIVVLLTFVSNPWFFFFKYILIN